MRIGVNTYRTGFSTAHGPITNSELTAKRAEDSMSMVAMVLYTPLTPTEDQVVARMLLPRRTSRTTIMRVRRTLSESEIENHARFHGRKLTGSVTGKSERVPVAILLALALGIITVRGELEYVPTEPRYMREGKTTAQTFLE